MQAGGCELYLIKMKRLDQFNEGKSPADDVFLGRLSWLYYVEGARIREKTGFRR